jgi:hypothetical protein
MFESSHHECSCCEAALQFAENTTFVFLCRVNTGTIRARREQNELFGVRVRFTLRQAFYRQSVFLVAKPLEAPSLRLLVPRSLQAFSHYYFIEGACLWRRCSLSRMALKYSARPDASFSGLDNVKPSFLVGWVSRCCSQAAPSLGLLSSSSMVILRARLRQCASAPGGLQLSLQAPLFGVE